MPQLRFGLMVLALVLAAVFLSHRFLTDTRILPPDDFVEYWAAGRLNAQGQNPYDPGLLMPLEVAAGRPLEQAILMWNPPWTLTHPACYPSVFGPPYRCGRNEQHCRV